VLHAIVGDGAVAQRHKLQRRSRRVFEDVDEVVVDVERAVLIELQESEKENTKKLMIW
jgi:ribosomal protein L20A (L18A)